MTREQLLPTLLCLAATPGLASAAAPQMGQQPARGPVIIHEPVMPPAVAPSPLVLLLHGFNRTQSDTMMRFGITDVVARNEGFVLCVPTGFKVPSDFISPPQLTLAGAPFWNASPACCDVAQLGVDDLTYLTDLIDTLVAGGSVDPRKVYAVGFSSGGFMAYRLLLEQPELFAGVATVAGSVASVDVPPTVASHVLHVHGEDDRVVSPDGGFLFLNLIAHITKYVAVGELINFWNAPAAGNFTFSTPPRLELVSSGTGVTDTNVERYEYNTPGGGSLEFWDVEQWGHLPPPGAGFNDALLGWLFEKRRDGEGTPACIAAPMTTCASDAELGAFEFKNAAGPDQLRLVAEGIPPGTTVHFSYSLQSTTSAPPTSGPCLCLTDKINRITSVSADAFGRVSSDFPKADLDALIGAGSTVYFQSAQNPGSGLEFSNVLVVGNQD
ncbi:MAG: prolyl oligopeptidase family serine peptidase [Planctomycetota bacterium]